MITAARPALLERDLHLRKLGELFDAASSGAGGAVAFVDGEAGAGKTALISALVDATPNARFLLGACDGVSTPRPLGPLHDMAARLPSEITGLLNDPATDRQRLFELVLEDLRGAGPTILVIDDLHWSDHATLDLLRFVGRRIATTRTLLIGTFRGDDVGPFDPLRIVIGDLATLSWTHHLDVPPLSAAAVADLASGRRIDAKRLHRLTGGNAFFVAEVLAAGDDDVVPTTVRDAVRARVGRLSTRGRQALEAAAVLGSRVEPWLLAAVAGEDLMGIDESLVARLLLRQEDSLAFRHELARLTVLEDIPLVRTIGLHRRALRFLSRSRGVDPARLAYHAEGAADAGAVVRHAREAGVRAVALQAHAEAIAQFQRVLRFGERLANSERAEILEAISYELFLTNHLGEAYDARAEALRLRDEAGDRLRIGDDRRYLSRVAWFVGRGEEAWMHARAAVDTLEPLGPGHELAMAWGNMAHLYMIDKQYEQAVAWGERALALARQLDDAEAIAYTLNNIGSAELEAGLETGRAKLLESLRIARQHTMQEHIDRALFNLGEAELAHHQYEMAEKHLIECLEFTASCDLERCQLLADSSRAVASLETGRWAEAEGMARTLISHPRTSPHGRVAVLAVLARLAMRRGSPEAGALLAEASVLADEAGGLGNQLPVAAAAAERAWLAGDPAGAAAAARRVYPLAIERGNPWSIGELASWQWRAGLLASVPPNAAEPFALELDGQPLAAAAAWERLGNPYQAALCRAGSDEPAQVRAAHDQLVELGAPATAEVVANRLRRLGAPVPRGPRAATQAHPAHLTSREAEIAALLADGLSNREIGRRLVITEKTVGHHVSAVLAKMGVTRRAEVPAAMAEYRSTTS